MVKWKFIYPLRKGHRATGVPAMIYNAVILFSFFMVYLLPGGNSYAAFPPVYVDGTNLIINDGTETRFFVDGFNYFVTGSDGNDLETYDHALMDEILKHSSCYGASTVGWRTFLKGTQLTFDGNRLCNGMTPGAVNAINAIKDTLDTAYEYGLVVLLTLSTAHFLSYGWGGATPENVTRVSNTEKLFSTLQGTEAYISNVIVPLVTGIGQHDALFSYLIINEVGGMVSDTPYGGWSDVQLTALDFQRYINRVAHAIHDIEPTALVSVSAVTFPNVPFWDDASLIAAGGHANGVLDYYQVQFYPQHRPDERSPVHNPCSYWGLDKPVVIGEFPMYGCLDVGDGFKPSSEKDIVECYNYLYDNDYAGGLAWIHSGFKGYTHEDTGVALMDIYEQHPENVTLGKYTPPVPKIWRIDVISHSQLDTIWSNVANECSYTLFRSTINDTNTAEIVTGMDGNVTNYSDIGLDQGTTYFYWAKAYNLIGSSGFSSSSASNITRDFTSAITCISNTNSAQDGRINSSGSEYDSETRGWAGDGTSGAEFRTLFGVNIASIPTNAIIFSGTFNFCADGDNSTYPEMNPYYVSLVDFGVVINNPDFGSAAIGGYVDFANFTSKGDNQNWYAIDVTDQVEYCLANPKAWTLDNSSNWLQMRIRPKGTHPDAVADKLKPITYDNGANFPYLCVDYGFPPAFPPAVPTGLIAAIDSLDYESIDISWNDVSIETSYTLYRSDIANDTNNAVSIAGLGVNQTSYKDIGLITNTTYYYWVKAYNENGASNYSSVASNTIPVPSVPDPPTWLTAILSGSNITVSWENVANETCYTLFRSDTANDTNTAVSITNTDKNVTAYLDENLTLFTTYYYWVKAYSAAGGSGYSTVVSNTPGGEAPPAELAISKTVSNIKLSNMVILDLIPGAAITYNIQYINSGASLASNVIIHDQLLINTIYKSNSAPGSWTFEYSTNPGIPDQSWGSTDYFIGDPGINTNVTWIRWTNPSVGATESDTLFYQVIIK